MVRRYCDVLVRRPCNVVFFVANFVGPRLALLASAISLHPKLFSLLACRFASVALDLISPSFHVLGCLVVLRLDSFGLSLALGLSTARCPVTCGCHECGRKARAYPSGDITICHFDLHNLHKSACSLNSSL